MTTPHAMNSEDMQNRLRPVVSMLAPRHSAASRIIVSFIVGRVTIILATLHFASTMSVHSETMKLYHAVPLGQYKRNLSCTCARVVVSPLRGKHAASVLEVRNGSRPACNCRRMQACATFSRVVFSGPICGPRIEIQKWIAGSMQLV